MKKYRNVCAAIAAIITWFALIVQAVLMIQNRVTTTPETLVRFFSFFTILTNIIVAICFTANAYLKAGAKSFFTRSDVLTALLVYIIIVALIYNTVLRFIWAPTGLQRVVDELLHLVNPILFLIFWIAFVPRLVYPLKQIIYWMIYPLFYLIWILCRGAISDFYPYPFMDVTKLGYHQVFINSLLILILFLFLSFLFLIISRTLAKRGKIADSN